MYVIALVIISTVHIWGTHIGSTSITYNRYVSHFAIITAKLKIPYVVVELRLRHNLHPHSIFSTQAFVEILQLPQAQFDACVLRWE